MGLLVWPRGWRRRKKSGLRFTPVPAPNTCMMQVMQVDRANSACASGHARRLFWSAHPPMISPHAENAGPKSLSFKIKCTQGSSMFGMILLTLVGFGLIMHCTVS